MLVLVANTPIGSIAGPVLLFILIPAWIIGGWGLLHWGTRHIARAGTVSALRSGLAHVLGVASSVASFGLLLGEVLPFAWAEHWQLWYVVRPYLATLFALLAYWLTTCFVLRITLRKAILGWMPQIWIVGILCAWFFWPSYPHSAYLGRVTCPDNLSTIGDAIEAYQKAHGGRMPTDLETLIQEGDIGFARICPQYRVRQDANWSREFDYFYMPAKESLRSQRQVVACDLLGNHLDGVRYVLFSDKAVVRMTAAEFEAEMRKPENFGFAAALRRAEKEPESRQSDE